MLQLRELPRPHRRRAEVAHLARSHQVVEGRHGLLDRRLGVEAVDVVDVDVVGAQPPQRRVDLFEDGLAGQAAAAGAVVHLPADLGGEHDVLAAGEPGDRPADELLRGAALVDVRGVPERDAQLDGLPEERRRGVLVQRPLVHAGGRVAVAHAAQPDPAHPSPVRPSRVYSTSTASQQICSYAQASHSAWLPGQTALISIIHHPGGRRWSQPADAVRGAFQGGVCLPSRIPWNRSPG